MKKYITILFATIFLSVILFIYVPLIVTNFFGENNSKFRNDITEIGVFFQTLVNFFDDNDDSSKNDTIKIGAIFPMTGGAAVYGQYFRDGILLALKNAENTGKIPKGKIKLIIEDGKAETVTSLSAFNKLTTQDQIQGLLIDLSSVILAVKPSINKAGIPSINSSSFSSEIEDADDAMFSILPNAAEYGKEIAAYSYSVLNKRKAAIIYRDDAMGVSFLENFTKVFQEMGGTVTYKDSHAVGAKEYTQVATKLKETGSADIVFIASYGDEAARLLKKLAEIEYKNTYITYQGFMINQIFDITGKATEGVYIVASPFEPENQKYSNLRKILEEELKSKDFNYYLAAHYDAMNLFIDAIANGRVTNDTIREYLRSINKFEGITGQINFDKNGLAHIPLSAYVIKDGKFVKLNDVLTK